MITEKPENDYIKSLKKDLQKILLPVIYFKYLYLKQNMCACMSVYECLCVYVCVCVCKQA